MHTVYLSLGSNIGDRLYYLKQALREISNTSDIKIQKNSPVYETEPVGDPNQDKFLNMVCMIQTNLKPLELLQVLMNVEKRLGRVRTRRWGPRTIDIDILLYDKEQIKHPDLIIPHPHMKNRAFVLIPLKEITPDIVFPDGDKLEDVLEAIQNQGVNFFCDPLF